GEDRDFGRNLRRDADAAGEDERDHLAREVHVRRPPAPARHDGVERAPEVGIGIPDLAEELDRSRGGLHLEKKAAPRVTERPMRPGRSRENSRYAEKDSASCTASMRPGRNREKA